MAAEGGKKKKKKKKPSLRGMDFKDIKRCYKKRPNGFQVLLVLHLSVIIIRLNIATRIFTWNIKYVFRNGVVQNSTALRCNSLKTLFKNNVKHNYAQ